MNLPKGCKTILLPHIVDDRGSLDFAEGGIHIPFEIKRIFWTYAVHPQEVRGNHAHRTCSMVLFPVGGSFTIELDDGFVKTEICMNQSHVGILIPPGVWCRLYNFTPQAACVCLASHPYEESDYIHDYNEFLKLTTL